MKRLLLGVAAALTMLVLPLAAGAGGKASDAGTTATMDTGSAIVLLNGEPLSTYAKTKPAAGKKIDFKGATVRAYRAQLSALRNDFKRWLRSNAPQARVTGEFDIALNAVGVELNGESLATVRSAPTAVGASYQSLYSPAGHDDPDLGLVSAFEAWTAGGGTATAKGAGVKVAIVDTGIDISHPCFSDGNPADDGAYTNDKVVVAKVFNNKSGVKGYTPEDVNGHGSHVAGTVACNEHTSAVVDGTVIPYAPSGVAPAATLGNYNVFPGETGNARSEDILDALEAAYEDGFDVANMSLGGSSSGIQDLLTVAVDNLDRAGMVVAVAAGNEGPGFSTVSSPGMAARALTAGASSVGHFIGTPVSVGALTVPAAAGEFATVTGTPLTAPLGVVGGGTAATGGLSTACSALPAGSLAGEVALISRGGCTFSQKIRNAENAGAVATLVVNIVAGDPVAMAQDGTANQPTRPAYMVSLANRAALMASDGAATTIPPTKSYMRTTNDDIRAGFSSEGPTDVDFRVKPDVMAPGVNVLSSVPMNSASTPSLTVGTSTYAPGTMDGSPVTSASAALADFGLGDAVNTTVSGKVCLIARGTIDFATKVSNCQNSGGVGAVVYNNVAGSFSGTLGTTITTIPSVTASDTEGAAMQGQLGQTATLALTPASYAYFDGTSMATPHVSAVAALVWSYFPACTGAQIRSSLTKSAQDLGPVGRDTKYGYGLVQAKAAHDRIASLGCGN